MRFGRALLVLLVVAACSGSDGEDAATTTTTSTSGVDGAVAALSAGDLRGIERDEALGDLLATLSEIDQPDLGGAASPEALRLVMAQLVEVTGQVAAVAPDIVGESAVVLAEGMAALDASLAEHDHDVSAAIDAGDPPGREVYDRPEFTVAGENLLLYRSEVCAISG